jgi:rhodanese-related sulfurtransferase
MKQHAEGFLKIALEAKQRVQEIDVDTVKRKLDENHKFYLIDVQETEEWQSHHILGAMHLSKGIIERDIEKTIPDKNSELVLYCSGGFRSALAADNVKNMGYKNVSSMEGGLRAWKNAGFPLAEE